MSEIQHVAPPSRYIPDRPEWRKGWSGPIEYLDRTACENGDAEEPVWCPAVINALGMVWYEDERGDWGLTPDEPTPDRLRLDPTRPEVRDLLARVLGLPDSHRVGEWAVPLAWWAGVTGRRIRYALAEWRHMPNDALWTWTRRHERSKIACDFGAVVGSDGYSIGGPQLGRETGPAGKHAADLAALNADCVLVTDGGLLLPPLSPGIAPILWSPE